MDSGAINIRVQCVSISTITNDKLPFNDQLPNLLSSFLFVKTPSKQVLLAFLQ